MESASAVAATPARAHTDPWRTQSNRSPPSKTWDRTTPCSSVRSRLHSSAVCAGHSHTKGAPCAVPRRLRGVSAQPPPLQQRPRSAVTAACPLYDVPAAPSRRCSSSTSAWRSALATIGRRIPDGA
eukprot:5871813-Prymnesium_polylepis.1